MPITSTPEVESLDTAALRTELDAMRKESVELAQRMRELGDQRHLQAIADQFVAYKPREGVYLLKYTLIAGEGTEGHVGSEVALAADGRTVKLCGPEDTPIGILDSDEMARDHVDVLVTEATIGQFLPDAARLVRRLSAAEGLCRALPTARTHEVIERILEDGVDGIIDWKAILPDQLSVGDDDWEGQRDLCAEALGNLCLPGQSAPFLDRDLAVAWAEFFTEGRGTEHTRDSHGREYVMGLFFLTALAAHSAALKAAA